MAKWNAKIRKKLKIGPTYLEAGCYIETDRFNDLISWLRDNRFKETADLEPEGERHFLSPDGKWLVCSRQIDKAFMFVQLNQHTPQKSSSESKRETTDKTEEDTSEDSNSS